MTSQFLTIVIPARNRPDFLELCLRSVFERQETRVKVIVSDNSTSELPTIVRLRNKYPFCYVRQSGKLTMVEHHNACLRLASTRWALLLHDDDELYPQSLSKIDAFLETAPEVGLIIGGFERIDECSSVQSVWAAQTVEELRGEAGVLRLGLDFRATPPATIYHVSSFRQIGGFPNALGASADYPLILRLINERGAILFPEVIGRYRIGNQQATDFTLTGAERTLDETILMSNLTRSIGVSAAVSYQLVDYNIWWIFRIIAGSWFSSHPFFVSRLFRKCLRSTPGTGYWKARVREEYPLLFFQPPWLAIFCYKAGRLLLPPSIRQRLGNYARAWLG
jgi:glycosyltransferase involved in cell wall biosynthesis